MFQNISGQVDEQIENEEKYYNDKINQFFKNAFSMQKIIIYSLSFMLSTIQCVDGIAPFAISIFAAVLSNKVPALIVYILTLIGTFVGLGAGQALSYLLTSLVFIAMILIKKPKENFEYENEKTKLGAYVFLSSFMVKISSILFGNFMVYCIK